MALSEAVQEKPPPETANTTKPDKKEKPLTKVIVRRLPPGMTKEEFLTQVSPVPDHDYIYGVRGDLAHGENAFSRFYMNFMNAEDVYIFKEKFDNYVFVDSKGHEYPAVVEYSSFQKVPKRRKGRPDPKINTVETDPIYQEFLESLKEQPNQEEKPEYSYQPSTENKNDVTTPLLDYLKQRKQDRMRMREEKREERRKKEVERKKVREDDRRKRTEEKVVVKTVKPSVLKESESKPEKKDDAEPEKPQKPTKEKKFEDRKPAKKYPSKYEEKREFNKSRNYREYHKEKFEEKKDQKKVKKYSERREERKNEASKAEAKKEPPVKEEKLDDKVETSKSRDNSEDNEHKGKNKENDPRVQRRIRNKDRPTMAIYKPGMLRKKSVDNDKDVEKEVEKAVEAEAEVE